MFDAASAALIRSAPRLPGIDPALLPQQLTEAYIELSLLRMQGIVDLPDNTRARLSRLSTISTVYEAIVDSGSQGDVRRAAAFVAGTAYQVQARFQGLAAQRVWFSAAAIDPAISAPLLFLIGEQSPDAREAGRALIDGQLDDLVLSALLESIADLASERFGEILRRAERLQNLSSEHAADLESEKVLALYGLCWRGVCQLAAQLLGHELVPSRFSSGDSASATFAKVVELASERIELPNMPPLLSTYPGPRHLARLLKLVADGFAGAAVMALPPPDNVNPQFWHRWLTHRAQTKPILWGNHRNALQTGFHHPGRSAVLVLPTGAGKTTLAEVKIATAIGAGRKVIFLVPTLALVDQLRDDLAEGFPEVLIDSTPSTTGDLTALSEGIQLNTIEVMTPERCLAVLSFSPEAFAGVGLIVFDECHLLSPSGGGNRSLDAMLCLLQATQRAPDADLLLLSAMLTNQGEVAAWIESLINRPCIAIGDVWKPSRQARGVVVYRRNELVAATELMRRPRARRRRNGPAAPRAMLDAYGLFGLHQNWHPNQPVDTSVVKILPAQVELAYSKPARRLTPNANAVASEVAAAAAVHGIKTIVFVQNASHAPSTARKISALLPHPGPLSNAEADLWAQISAELGNGAKSLVDPAAGAIPHNGDMLSVERRFAETRFRRIDGARVIVATPTLAQGMNLPAQLAILAGDKRHGDGGRNELDPHEILNAAGRAGRAGHLANGMVLLIPEPIVALEAQGPEPPAFEKLLSVMPQSDACLEIEDPLELVLDHIQAGGAEDPLSRYLFSRLSAGHAGDLATAAASTLVGRSFYAFKARRAGQEARVDTALTALRVAMQAQPNADPTLSQIASFTGLLPDVLLSAQARLAGNVQQLPTNIPGWTDWIVDWVRDSADARTTLDEDVLRQVLRGTKAGGEITPQEFESLKRGLRAWLGGAPFSEIEIALGVPAQQVGFCPRSRDLSLKMIARGFYIVAVAIAGVAKEVLGQAGATLPNPVVLEVLPLAVRMGFDSPEKVAFQHLNPTLRPRVIAHREFTRRTEGLAPIVADSFVDLLNTLQAYLAFLEP